MVSAEAAIGAWTRELRFFRFRETEIDGIPVVVARSGWSKQGGFEIYLRDGSLGGALWDRIMDAGRPFGIRPGAPNLIERIESRLISYGTDVTLEHDPFEAGLDAFCDLDKPAEYLARDALAARRGRPSARRLERVVIGGQRRPPVRPATAGRSLGDAAMRGRGLPARGLPAMSGRAGSRLAPCERVEPNPTFLPLHVAGRAAGHVTSAAYSPRLDCNVALAMVATQRGEGVLRVALPDGSEREAAVADGDWNV